MNRASVRVVAAGMLVIVGVSGCGSSTEAPTGVTTSTTSSVLPDTTTAPATRSPATLLPTTQPPTTQLPSTVAPPLDPTDPDYPTASPRPTPSYPDAGR